MDYGGGYDSPPSQKKKTKEASVSSFKKLSLKYLFTLGCFFFFFFTTDVLYFKLYYTTETTSILKMLESK